MTAPEWITTELDAVLKDYTAGNDRAVRFVTIDQVDMLAEFYLHNRATERKLAKAVEALRYYAVEAMPWEADDSLIARTTLAEIKGEKP
jgi:hypothetical protein